MEILTRATIGLLPTLGLCLALGASLVHGAGAPARAETQAEKATEKAAVTAFIEKLNQESNALLGKPSPDGARAILDWAFDVPAMGQYALGDAWATAASRLVGRNVDKVWIWRMRKDGASWRIADVMIDGRSALYSEKQDYREILEANEGDIGAVIAFIRRRT